MSKRFVVVAILFALFHTILPLATAQTYAASTRGDGNSTGAIHWTNGASNFFIANAKSDRSSFKPYIGNWKKDANFAKTFFNPFRSVHIWSWTSYRSSLPLAHFNVNRLAPQPAFTCSAGATCWVGGASGNWSVASNWSNGVPTGSTNVLIDNNNANGQGASTVTLDTTGNAASLTVDSDDSLKFANNTTLNISLGGAITDAGSISIDSTGNGTNLYLGNGSGTTTLSGGGTVTLADTLHNAEALIYGDGGVVLENVNNTIEGEGQIGATHAMELKNDSGGTVDANVSGQTLYLNGNVGGFSAINTGLLEATNGGTLQIVNAVNNSGGTISTDSGHGSVVLLNNATIQAGTLNGNVETENGSLLDGTTHGTLTNAGTVTVLNNTTLNLSGTINNTGAIDVASTGNGTNLYIGNGSGTVTLTGSGTVTLSGASANFYGDGGNTLENTNNTIEGVGQIGATHAMVLKNDSSGVVDANLSGQTLYLNGNVGGFSAINTGLLEATNGGTLQIVNAVNNSGGTISTDSGHGSVVLLNNGTIEGGTLKGNIETSGATLDGTTHGTLTNAGTVTVLNNTTLNLVGTINNTSTIDVASTGNGTTLYIGNGSGTVTLTGSGTVTLSGAAANFYGDGGNTLENVNNTIQGVGQIGATHGMVLKNDSSGIVDANVSGQTLTLNAADGIINAGTLEATGGGILQITNTVQNNPNSTTSGGLITASGTGSEVLLSGNADIEGGTLSGNVVTTGGLLDGRSTSEGQVNNKGSITIANNSTLNADGTINNTGSITLASTGNGTNLYIGNGSGTVTLTGSGTVTLADTAHNGEAIIYGDGGNTLENVNNTIQGEGTIGSTHAMLLLNDSGGVVDANVSGQALTINGNVSGFSAINAGMLEATNGGTLQIQNTVNNSGGKITTDSGHGSVVLLNGATIQGGTLSGTVETETATLDGTTQGALTNAGTLTTLNNTTLYVGGTINNTGTINLASTGNGTNIYLGNGSLLTKLTGKGKVVLSDTAHNSEAIIYGDGGATLENVSNTIEGEGQIGATHGMALQNDSGGTIYASVKGQSLILSPAGAITNNGTFKVATGATMVVEDGAFTNFAGSTLTGGTYNVSGKLQIFELGSAGGEIVTNASNIILSGASSSFVDSAGNNALTNFATNASGAGFTIKSGRNFTTAGNFTNNGTLTVGSSNSKFDVNGNLTNFSGTTLTGGTYDITGTLQFNGANIVTNAAKITLSGTSYKIINQSGANALANFATNASGALFGLASKGTFTTGGNFSNAGTLSVASGTSLTVGGAGMLTQTAGKTTDDGTVTDSGGFSLGGGSLFGKGSVVGNLNNSAGTVTPGDSSTSTGILTDTGAYTQGSGGALDITIAGTTAGTKFDELNVSGAASLNGTLNISLKSFVPTVGETFKIVNYGSESGTFSTVNGLAINSSEHFTIAYQGSDVLLTVVSGAAPGTSAVGQGRSSVNNLLRKPYQFGGAGSLALRSLSLDRPGAALSRSIFPANASSKSWTAPHSFSNVQRTFSPHEFAARPAAAPKLASLKSDVRISPAVGEGKLVSFEMNRPTFAASSLRFSAVSSIAALTAPQTTASFGVGGSVFSNVRAVAPPTSAHFLTRPSTMQRSTLATPRASNGGLMPRTRPVAGGLSWSPSNLMAKPKFGFAVQ